MSKFKLTKAGRAVVGVVLAVAVAIGIIGGIKGGVIKFDKKSQLHLISLPRMSPRMHQPATTRSICLWMNGRDG